MCFYQLISSMAALFLMCSPLKIAHGSAFDEKNPLSIQAFTQTPTVQAHLLEVKIKTSIPAGYYYYADKIKFWLKIEDTLVPLISGQVLAQPGVTLNFQVEKIFTPDPQRHFDPIFKKDKWVFSGETNFIIRFKKNHLSEPNPYSFLTTPNIQIGIQYQACYATFCLFPVKKFTPIQTEPSALTKVTGIGSTIGAQPNPIPETIRSSQEEFGLSAYFQNALKKSFAWACFWAFVAGFITSLTPCVFPTIPLVMASVRQFQSAGRSEVLGSSLFVSGLVASYTLLGLIAGLSGSLFGALLARPEVNAALGLIFVALSLSLFGFFELQSPYLILNKVTQIDLQKKWGVFLAGATSGLVAAPCVGPVLIAILTYISTTQDTLRGGTLLLFFSLGLGLLFLLIGIFSGRMHRFLPRSGTWMNLIKDSMGLVTLAMAIFYLKNIFTYSVQQTLWLAWLVLTCTYFLRAFSEFLHRWKIENLISNHQQEWHHKTALWLRFILQAIFLLVVIMLVHNQFSSTLNRLSSKIFSHPNQEKISGRNTFEGLKFESNLEQGLQQALTAQQPMFIDFSADWCVACHELEEVTFKDEKLKNLLTNFKKIRVDLTAATSENEIVQKKMGIQGLPTLLILDKTGKEKLRITEFISAQNLIKKISGALK